RLWPSNAKPSPAGASRTAGASMAGRPSSSCQAPVATSSPAASRGPIAPAPAQPARSIARAATAAEMPKGETTPRRPISSATMATTRASSMPPSASRIGAASRPASASAAWTCAQRSAGTPARSSSSRAAASRIIEYSSGATKARVVASGEAFVFIVLAEKLPGGDVALDLVGTGVDRGLAQVAVGRGHAGGRKAVHAEDARLQFGDVLLQVRADDLEQRGIEVIPDALLQSAEHLQVHQLDAGEPRLERGQSPRDGGILEHRSAVAHRGGGQPAQQRELALAEAHAAEVQPLVLEQVLGAGPAAPFRADEVLDGNPHLVEPDLVDLVVPVEGDDGPDLDTGAAQVHEQEADPVLLARSVGSAHQAEDPVGEMRRRGPDLLAVDDVVVAAATRPRAQAGEVGARAGLGVALCPPGIARGDRGQEAPLLDRKSTRLNSSHVKISYAVFCLKKKK